MATKKSSDEHAVVRVGDVPASLLAMIEQGKLPDTMETMRHHRILNRVAILQPMSGMEFKKKYGEGSAIIPAADQLLIKTDESFDMVPVMFFDEFVCWADRRDKSGPMIREKSLDRASILAAKCSDPNRRKEAYGEPLPDGTRLTMRNTHHLNFLCVVYSGPLKGTQCVVSLNRAEFKKGMSLISAIRMRKIQAGNYQVQAPMWSTVWKVTVGHRTNDKGQWYGFDFSPADQPWVDNDDAEPFKSMYDELLKDYKEQLIVVGHEAAEGKVEGDDPANETEM